MKMSSRAETTRQKDDHHEQFVKSVERLLLALEAIEPSAFKRIPILHSAFEELLFQAEEQEDFDGRDSFIRFANYSKGHRNAFKYQIAASWAAAEHFADEGSTNSGEDPVPDGG